MGIRVPSAPLDPPLHHVIVQASTKICLTGDLYNSQMYDHILELEREVFWIYGNVTCAAYPLQHIDTISERGEINTKSAMYHIVYGVSNHPAGRALTSD